MLTAEKLMTTSLKTRLTANTIACLANGVDLSHRRSPDSVFGTVMSSAEVNEALGRRDPDLLLSATGLVAVSNGEVFFLTDDASFGYGVLPESFRGMSMRMPSRVAPRPSVPDGWMETAEQFISVFYAGERQLSSLIELLEYVNATQEVAEAA